MKEELLTTIQTLIHAEDWFLVKGLAEVEPELLSETTRQFLREVAEVLDDTQKRRGYLLQLINLLEASGRVGIDAAFAPLLCANFEQELYDGMLAELGEFGQPEDRARRIRLAHILLSNTCPVNDPRLCALLHMELAESHLELPDQSEARALKSAIYHYRTATLILKADYSYHAWAIGLNSLAELYFRGTKQGIFKRERHACACLKKVLKDIDPSIQAGPWSTAANMLGNYYMEHHVDNVEAAVHLFQKVLSVLDAAGCFPMEKAQAESNLAGAFKRRKLGDPSENFLQAAQHYQQALTVFESMGAFFFCAIIRMNMANLYSIGFPGSPYTLHHKALDLYQEALAFLSKEEYPEMWTQVHLNLGTLYQDFREKCSSDYIEKSRKHFSHVLEVADPQEDRDTWMSAKLGLGRAWMRMPTGDKAVNLEYAVKALKEGLSAQEGHEMSLTGALIHLALGEAMIQRHLGAISENRETGLDLFMKVLPFFEQRQRKEELAPVYATLGEVYFKRYQGIKKENLQSSISYFQQAMTFKLDPTSRKSIRISHGLAASYLAVSENNEAQMAEAERLLLNSLEQSLSSGLEEESQEILCSLGRYFQEHTKGDPSHNQARALNYFKSALQYCKGDHLRSDYAQILGQIGSLHFDRGDWVKASSALIRCLQILESLYQKAQTYQGKMVELNGFKNFPALATFSLAKQGRLREAVEVTETNRARQFLELRKQIPSMLDGWANHEQLVQANDRVWHCDSIVRNADEHPGLNFGAAVEDLMAARKAWVHAFEEAGLAGNRLASPTGYEAAASVSQSLGRAVVYLLTTSKGSLALICMPTQTPTEVVTCWLEGLSFLELRRMLFDQDRDGCFIPAILQKDQDQVLMAYDLLERKLTSSLVAPLEKRLCELGITDAVLIPSGELALIPLPAMATTQVSLGYAPSSTVLGEGASRRQSENEPIFVGIGHLADDDEDLPFSRIEINAVSETFSKSDNYLEDPKSSQVGNKHNFFTQLQSARFVHIACHAYFFPGRPLDSALLIASERITIRDLLNAKLSGGVPRLIVLSACQTALGATVEAMDEFTGFPLAFLIMGVQGVLCSHWSVSDISTALLMKRFYHNLLNEEMHPTRALRFAQEWLKGSSVQELGLIDILEAQMEFRPNDVDTYRRLRYYRKHPQEQPFKQPYFWAGFTFWGD